MNRSTKALITFAALSATPVSLANSSKVDDTTIDFYRSNYGEYCNMDLLDVTYGQPERLDIGKEWPQIVRFTCESGAYNYMHLYLKVEAIGEVSALQFPRVNIDSVGNMIGISADEFIVNSNYDKEKNQIIEFSKWRGVGDASSYSEYTINDSTTWAPLLTKTQIDATYDGEINPKTVFEVK